MQKVAARRRQQRQQGASESRAQICKGRCSKQRQEAGRGGVRQCWREGGSSCCREDVAGASAVANCGSKPQRRKFRWQQLNPVLQFYRGKGSRGGGKKWQGQPGVTSIIVKCSEAFGQLQHQQRTFSLAPCHICSRVFPESKLRFLPHPSLPLLLLLLLLSVRLSYSSFVLPSVRHFICTPFALAFLFCSSTSFGHATPRILFSILCLPLATCHAEFCIYPWQGLLPKHERQSDEVW